MSFGRIYAITHLPTGRFYIGQTRHPLSARWSVHKSEAKRRPRSHLHKAIRKHGADEFEIQQLTTASSLEDLNRLETLWIVATGACDRHVGFNASFGGDSRSPTIETRQKLRFANLGKRLSPKHAVAFGKHWLGKHQSADHRAKRTAPLKGRRPSEACLKAVSAANRLRNPSPETREKLRRAAQKANEVRWGHRQSI